MGSRLAVGTVLDDRFELVRFLGAGSYGDVFLARQSVFGHHFRDVALKLFNAEAVTSENAGEVFNDAITVIRLLEDDPPEEVARRIVRVFDVGFLAEPKRCAYMSMELVRSERTLDHVVREHREGNMDLELFLWYLERILVPLAWLHEQEIVHGDLKPDNILLREDSDVVITDFGLAARVPVGVEGGAVQYQAPEVLSGLRGGTQSDVYSMGVTMYEMLTGRHPFGDVGLPELGEGNARGYVRAQLAARKWPMRPGDPSLLPEEEGRIQPPSEINETLSEHPQLEAIVARCLDHRISDRFSNAGMLLRELRKYEETGEVDQWVIARGPTSDTRLPTPGAGEKSPDAVVRDAETLSARGEIDRALTLLEGIREHHEDFLPALLAEARILSEQRRIDDARTRLDVAMRVAPKDPEVFETLGFVLAHAGQTDLAHQMRKHAEKLRAEAR